MEILGYSAYWHSNQTLLLETAYRIKSEVVREAQKSEYGIGLDTLLVFYNFETEPDEFAGTNLLSKKIEIQRYNSNEKSIRVNVFVGFNELIGESYEKQVEFYYITTMEALSLAKEKFAKRKKSNIEVDFEKLHQDIKQGYLEAFNWLE